MECSDGTFYSLRASVHGKVTEINESLGRRAQLMVEHASWEGFLALFTLMPKAKAMLSLEDRILEGSEAERDRAENMQLTPEARIAPPPPAAAAATAPADASPATTAAAAALAAQEQAQLEGRAWQSSIEYLTPSQYLEKRKNFFVAANVK